MQSCCAQLMESATHARMMVCVRSPVKYHERQFSALGVTPLDRLGGKIIRKRAHGMGGCHQCKHEVDSSVPRTKLKVFHLLFLVRDPSDEPLFEVELLEHALNVTAADVRHHEAFGQEASHDARQRALGDVGRMRSIAVDGGWRHLADEKVAAETRGQCTHRCG